MYAVQTYFFFIDGIYEKLPDAQEKTLEVTTNTLFHILDIRLAVSAFHKINVDKLMFVYKSCKQA